MGWARRRALPFKPLASDCRVRVSSLLEEQAHLPFSPPPPGTHMLHNIHTVTNAFVMSAITIQHLFLGGANLSLAVSDSSPWVLSPHSIDQVNLPG